MTTQTLRSEIDAALAAHDLWKQKLSTAAHNKDRELPVGTICRDDQCTFGKWFYSQPEDLRFSRTPYIIRKLHSDFHLNAGRVALDLARGEFDEALKRLESPAYKNATTELTKALVEWRDE